MSIILNMKCLCYGNFGNKSETKERDDTGDNSRDGREVVEDTIKRKCYDQSSQKTREKPRGEQHLISKHQGYSIQQANHLNINRGCCKKKLAFEFLSKQYLGFFKLNIKSFCVYPSWWVYTK